jgi:hypothetical protein
MRLKTMWLCTRRLCALCCLILLTACAESPAADAITPAPVDVVDLASLDVVAGQTIYVPAYSELYFTDERSTWSFAITLAIHNADLAGDIYITSVRYYNDDGDFVRDFVIDPVVLPALGTRAFVIEERDRSGGVGANFIVEWVAESAVTPPVVEAVMISAARQQGLSLISPGRVISDQPPTSDN